MVDAVYGCDGCRTTLGRGGCPTHRDRDHGYACTSSGHDFEPYPWVAGPQRIFCRKCGEVRSIESGVTVTGDEP